jgi:hypothetical protein
MRSLVALAVVAVAGILPVVGSPGPDAKPRLVVVDRTPLVVRGLRFRADETVLVRAIVRGKGGAAKSMVAGAGGGFTARFPSMWVRECAFLSVQATGSRGSRALVHPDAAALRRRPVGGGPPLRAGPPPVRPSSSAAL